MSNRHDEDLLCMAFKSHLDIYFPETPGKLVWTHIANQGRSPQEGDKLKKMGVHAGWFDYIFECMYGSFFMVHLEAKVIAIDKNTARKTKRDYSDSQKKFDHMTNGMPVHKAKFYTVEEGHNLLKSFGVPPRLECKLFKEPSLVTWQDKIDALHRFQKP